MFLNSIALEKILPCLAEPGKIIVIGIPDRHMDEVIPYLAALPGIISYNPDTSTLTFRRTRGFMTLYADKVYITQVDNVEEGVELLKGLTEAINATWEHRSELVAQTRKRAAPRPLDIYTLLPQTNCRQCGEATCMAFACSLLLHQRKLAECLPLQADSSAADRLSALEAML